MPPAAAPAGSSASASDTGVIRFRADWVLPIAGAPIRDAAVTVDAAGRIVAVGPAGGDVVDCGRVAILPALVNAHTHLELSYLRGRVPPAARFVDWIRQLMQARRAHADPADPVIVRAMQDAIREARAAGTGLVGDVSNTLVSVPALREAGLPAQVFHELLGFNVPDADQRVSAAAEAAAAVSGGDVRVSLAAHAPYSVSPALFAGLRVALDRAAAPVSSIHLGESADEVELLDRGSGPLRELLEELGAWTDAWRCPGVSPVAYLSDLGFLDRSVLVVHGVQLDGEDLARLAALGVTLVSCPRSNRHVGVGSPPLEAFYAMDVEVALGTDSLASVPDLNLFRDLAAARRLAPRVPARRLLESATLIGARALRFDTELGSLEPGKRAALIAVRVPEGVRDVEEYLVSGIEPDAVRWVRSAGGAANGAVPAS
jgi:aminodeoxyfutalosine deaminase